MIIAKRVPVTLLCCAVLTYAQGNIFNKVRYNGGSVFGARQNLPTGARLK